MYGFVGSRIAKAYVLTVSGHTRAKVNVSQHRNTSF
jgi:hypothetical protein